MTHHRNVCEYGVIHSQCRCPSPTKAEVRIVCDTPAEHDPEVAALTTQPTWSADEHCRIRFRLVAEYDAAISEGRPVFAILGLMADELRWLVGEESEDGHAKPHECATATIEQTAPGEAPAAMMTVEQAADMYATDPPQRWYLGHIVHGKHGQKHAKVTFPVTGPVDEDTIRAFEVQWSALLVSFQPIDPPDVSR